VAEWLETYRGVVNAWECDVVEHFTIAYYFDRFADSSRNLLELIGEGEALIPLSGTGPSRLVATFQHELRGGAGFHILSAVNGLEGDTLRLGHNLIDSTSGKTCTWLAETLHLPASIGAATRRKLQSIATPWTGPEVPAASAPPAAKGMLTARDRVKPWEIAEHGMLALPDYVHRFSGAGMQFLGSIGMTGNYMYENRRGFSTFLLDIELKSGIKAGQRVDVHTAVVNLGNTSLRYVHRMTDAQGRDIASMVQAGVHLDLDARRPTAMPASIRDAIAAAIAAG
jgi:acyl-CoA thioesterase FadM